MSKTTTEEPTMEATATRVLSRNPYREATARVFSATDNDGEPYFDWSVITNDGQVLAQERSEPADHAWDGGEPTQTGIEDFLTSVLSR